MESTKTVSKTAPKYHTLVHFEIPAKEPSKIARFYEQLFGWKFTKPIERTRCPVDFSHGLQKQILQRRMKIFPDEQSVA